MSTVVEAKPLEALVEAREHVLATAPFAVGPGPHVVAGLGRDHEFVAQAAKVAAQDVAEGELRGARRGPVIVGEIEMRDPEIEGPAADGAFRFRGLVEAEIVPQAQRDRRQFQPAAAAAVIDHRIITGRRRRVGHGRPCRSDGEERQFKRVNPSALQSSLPTPWWRKNRPSGSYLSLIARSRA